MELGQRYSVMIKLDQQPDSYNFRFATYPSGDMQQVLEGYAVVSYSVSAFRPSTWNSLTVATGCKAFRRKHRPRCGQ